MIEEWRDVWGYEGLYQVSSFGRVRGIKSGVIFKPQLSSDKLYYQVSLRKNGRGKTFKIHRLVAAAFLRLPEANEEIDHIDDNGFNNKLSNLQWILKRDNLLKAHRDGRQSGSNHSRFGKKGLNNPTTKMFSLRNPEGVIITSYYSDFKETYGLDPTCVWRVLAGSYSHHKGWTKCN